MKKTFKFSREEIARLLMREIARRGEVEEGFYDTVVQGNNEAWVLEVDLDTFIPLNSSIPSEEKPSSGSTLGMDDTTFLSWVMTCFGA